MKEFIFKNKTMLSIICGAIIVSSGIGIFVYNSMNNESDNSKNDDDNTKKIMCSMTDSSDRYQGDIETTTTFENDAITSHTLYIEKAFKDGYKAEDDGWTTDHIEALKNEKDGITGNIEIKNNTTYLTMTYNVKENPNLLELITYHTEYNDFLNNMRSNGYICNEK